MLFHSTGVYKKLYKGGVGAHRYVFTARLFFLLMGCIHYTSIQYCIVYTYRLMNYF